MDEDLDLAYTLRSLGDAALTEGRLEEAEEHYQRVLAIMFGRLPADNVELRKAVQGYAELLRKLGRTSEAEELEMRAGVTDGSAGS